MSEQTFDVESPEDVLAAIPPALLSIGSDLSPSARVVLMFAFALPGKPTKDNLKTLAGLGESKWLSVCRELQQKGWLIRKNHGGGGRGVWRHERTFLRTPRRNPLL